MILLFLREEFGESFEFIFIKNNSHGWSVNVVLGPKTIFSSLNGDQHYPISEKLLQIFAEQFSGKIADFIDDVTPQFHPRNFL